MEPDYLVECLCSRTEENGLGMKWHEHSDDWRGTFYVAEANGVHLVLQSAHTHTAELIFLTLFDERVGKTAISEPVPHISAAPIGKMWNAFAELFGLPSINRPSVGKKAADERLRVAMNDLFRRTVKQNESSAAMPREGGSFRALLEKMERARYVDDAGRVELLRRVVFR